MAKKLTKILWYGNDVDASGKAVPPSIAPSALRHLEGLNRGELYISDNPLDPALFIRLSNDTIIRVGDVHNSSEELAAITESLGILSSMFALVDSQGNEITSLSEAVAIKAKKNFFSIGEVSAYGMGNGESNGGGGSSFDLLQDWGSSEPANSSQMALGANLGYWLKNKVEELDLRPSSSVSDTERNNWNTAYNFVNSITGADADNVINKWDEIVSFLDGIAETDRLDSILVQFVTTSTLNTTLASYLPKSTFDELFEKVNVGTEESPKWAIKAKLDFFSVGEVSAYGMGTAGAGSGGSTTLVGLDDTNITSPATGQILMFNGTSWVNSAAPASTSAVITGTGSVIKDASLDGGVLTITKGNLAASDIPNLPWSKITSGVPTSLAGFGITQSDLKGTLGMDGTVGSSVRPVYLNSGTLTQISSWGNDGARLAAYFSTLNANGGITLTGTTAAANTVTFSRSGGYNYIVTPKIDKTVLAFASPSTGAANTKVVFNMTTGNVGIGTTSPTEKLDVNGTAKVTSLKIGGATITYNSTHDCIVVDKCFASMAEVSAYGISASPGGSGGASALSMLDDTNITSPSEGQVLQYDGTSWVNAAAPTTFTATVSGTGSFIKVAAVQGDVLALTKGNLTSTEVTTALGFTPYNSASFTKDNIKNTLGIADWALGATAPALSLGTAVGSGNAVTGIAVTGHEITLKRENTFLEKAKFDELFEKVNLGTDEEPLWTIRAKFSFYSDYEVSAYGANTEEGGGSGSGDVLGDWDNYDPSTASATALGANLGKQILDEIEALKQKGSVSELGVEDANNEINSGLPAGERNHLYIDPAHDSLYRYDDGSSEYRSISSRITTAKILSLI